MRQKTGISPREGSWTARTRGLGTAGSLREGAGSRQPAAVPRVVSPAGMKVPVANRAKLSLAQDSLVFLRKSMDVPTLPTF